MNYVLFTQIEVLNRLIQIDYPMMIINRKQTIDSYQFLVRTTDPGCD
jgi:hypothetical protein